jgi:flagellar motor switch protein FliN/FliY
MADEHDTPDTPRSPQPDDRAQQERAQDADALSPEEAIEDAKDAVDDVADADAASGPTDLTDDILAAARAAVADAASVASSTQDKPQASPPPGADAHSERLDPIDLPTFDAIAGDQDPKGIDLLSDVNLNVSIELGRTRMLVEDVLRLTEGAVVELDKLAGDPVDVYVNERLVARGEVLVLNDTFCIRVNEIVKQAAEAVAELR